MENDDTLQPGRRGWRFWAIFVSLIVSVLLSAVEVSVVSTALPVIVRELDIGSSYEWIVNSYLLTTTAFQPILGQLADAFGRRWLTIICVAMFTLGSGISGGATSGSMLIAGRAVQGFGGGGLNMLVDLIICDLVPLRQRGKFVGLVGAFFSIGVFLGPFIGGSLVDHSTWHWVFYMNLPIGGVSMVLLYLFLHVDHPKKPLGESLRSIDWIGNIIVMGSTVAVLFALAYAGNKYAWSSVHIIAPLVVGLVGLIVFHAYEASPFCSSPTIPPRLFGNRTSVVAFALTFVHAMLTVWVLYFLPVYFQAVLAASPTRSGVNLLPTVLGLLPAALMGGAFLTRTGKYLPLHYTGVGLMVIGLAAFTVLDADTSTGVWVVLQLVQSMGNGFIATSLLPAIQAGLTDDDNAVSTATWSYVRSYGAIWGVTIPAVAFNNEFDKRLHGISSPEARASLAGGNAYAHASKKFILSFPQRVRDEIIGTYVKSLRVTWIIATALTAFFFVVVFFEKQIPLRDSLKTEFGIKEKKKPAPDPEEVTDASELTGTK